MSQGPVRLHAKSAFSGSRFPNLPASGFLPNPGSIVHQFYSQRLVSAHGQCPESNRDRPHPQGSRKGLKHNYPRKQRRGGPGSEEPGRHQSEINLLNFDSCPSVGEFLLDGLSFFLADAFLDRLGSAVNQVLSFLQA